MSAAASPQIPGPRERAALAARLRREIEGEVLFGPDDRARYATDASIYEIPPVGVICPRHETDLEAALAIAREAGVPVIARGAGTSQAGQTVGRALVLDCSRHMTTMGPVDTEAMTVTVEPGLVLDELNRRLRPGGLFYPVDISTGSRATLGGMAANNACGARSLRYGVSVDNVLAIEATLADGTRLSCGEVPPLTARQPTGRLGEITAALRAIAAREAAEIAARWPKSARNVAGYTLNRVDPEGAFNLASLLVGSEGTLALFRRLTLKLHPLPRHRVLGVCHFPTFRRAMEAAGEIVGLGPTAVELVDRTILDLAAGMPEFRDLLPKFLRGRPEALHLVEFAGEERAPLERALARLGELLADRGLPEAVVAVTEPTLQGEIWELRKAGLNIVMSMKGDRKPVSFIEDCAVPLEHLAEYTEALDALFARHGTRGTWYAHAAVGCLHVRPVLNLKDPVEVGKMRAIAEEAIDLVRRFRGSHSGEHGDGIVRSEFHRRVLGGRLVDAFTEIKDLFDPEGVLNTAPSKIVRPPRMDDRDLLRHPPDYRPLPLEPRLDWGEWGGFLAAVEMCNNNGACRKLAGGVMCPSYRVTREEKHLTRGRANLLRHLLTGRAGGGGLASEELFEALSLCVSCKACRRECPTGVDMARMKVEVLSHYYETHRRPLRERLLAGLPRWAGTAAKFRPLLDLADALPGAGILRERLLGFDRRRPLPRFRRPWRPPAGGPRGEGGERVVLFADTFNRHFEPENLDAAWKLLERAGAVPLSVEGADGRALCCGRTRLAAGMVEEARAEMRRLVEALAPLAAEGIPILGLEPACLLTLRDELGAVLADERSRRIGEMAMLCTSFLKDRIDPEGSATTEGRRILVHGHCHQKAFGVAADTVAMLRRLPGVEVRMIESGCCGMAGAFGYRRETFEISMRMAELDLLPAIRGAPDAIIVADGTSCRQQIRDGTGREALHGLRVMAERLA